MSGIDIDAAGLSQIGSRYLTRVSLFTAPINGVQKCLSADARRYTVRFMPGGAATGIQNIVPGPPPAGLLSTTIAGNYVEWDFAKWPGAVGGEFYVNIILNGLILIVEQLYLG